MAQSKELELLLELDQLMKEWKGKAQNIWNTCLGFDPPAKSRHIMECHRSLKEVVDRYR